MKPIYCAIFGISLGLISVVIPNSLSAEETPTVRFERDIQPLFRRHCYRCHGTTKAEGGFQLSKRESALGAGDSGETIITPGKPDESLLLTRLTDADYGDVMPLDGARLSDEDIVKIRRWIEAGAKWPNTAANDRHWAYVPPQRPAVPKVQQDFWPKNSIDFFVLHRLEQEGFTPSSEAERTRLIRRVSLALTGLPPTLAEVDAFVSDPSPNAYEELVDRLLRSQRYGEKWARHWLDLARYADSNGYQADQLRDSWAYRDWVIRAFNDDMPFDQFVIEQMAGDLLPNATLDQKIATGFHRTPTCNVEAGVHPEANRVNQVFDRVNTTATVFLGTTLECCQCHDHKYDPFTQRDYYRLFAYFNNTPLEVKLDSGVQFDFYGPKMDLPLDDDKSARQREFQRQLGEIETQKKELRQTLIDGLDNWIVETRSALETNPATWNVASLDDFTTSSDEEITRLEDGSVLLSGDVPKTGIYRIRLNGPFDDLVGFKIETLTHESLPGKGPGRGDKDRPNAILNEFTVQRQSGETVEPLALRSAQADFSQKNWEVAKAIDGDRKTGWAIAPEFHKPHWATFLLTQPIDLAEGESLELALDQNYGGGRLIGRLRLSLLQGDVRTAGLPDDVIAILNLDEPNPKQQKRLRDYCVNSHPDMANLEEKAKQIRQKLNRIKPPSTLVMVEQEEPRDTHIFQRGDYLNPGEKVSADTPETLHPLNASLSPDRLGLARWLVSRENPLLARVTVNRIWTELFGRGLVATPEDFGTQGEPPSHPELLDWLAVEFMESGWSIKQLQKQIVMSATFRQSARVTPRLLRRDPDNRRLARGPRFRLSAETIRDNALAISGMLSKKMYGPPIMPYQPSGIWKSIGRNQPTWKTAENEDRFRRGVYVVWKRAAPYPSFVNFDAPDRAACTVQRPRTNTPLQALTLLNDPAYAEMALALAQRMMTETPDESLESRAAYGFRLCVARAPSERETQILVKLFLDERKKLAARPELVRQRIQNLLPRLQNTSLDCTDLAAWFAVANVLLNLDETVSL